MLRRIRSVHGIRDAYSRRILGNLIGKDPEKIYRTTPKTLSRLTRGLTTRQLFTPPARGRWSIGHLVSHLCDAECAMSFRIRKALAETGCKLPAYDQNKWAARLHYEGADLGEKLALFTALRRVHASLLRELTNGELRRYGIHPERGKETVERMFHLLAGHDVNHLRQVRQIRRKLSSKPV